MGTNDNRHAGDGEQLERTVFGKDLAERLGVGPGRITNAARGLSVGAFEDVEVMRTARRRRFALSDQEVGLVIDQIERDARHRLAADSELLAQIEKVRG